MSKLIAVAATIIALILTWLNGRRSGDAAASKKDADAARADAMRSKEAASKAIADAEAGKSRAEVAEKTATLVQAAGAETARSETAYEAAMRSIQDASDRGDFDALKAIAAEQARKARERMKDAQGR